MTVHDNRIVNAVSILSERTGKECKSRICSGCLNCIGIKGTIYEKIKRPIHRVLFKRINLYITPSRYMESLINEAGFYPSKTINNGINLYTPSDIKNFNHILYIGRLVKEKGLQILIQALDQIKKKFSNIKLTIIGSGSKKSDFVTLSKKLCLESTLSHLV
jgi:glycosyltransferase involved in cell wall biosynthesis